MKKFLLLIGISSSLFLATACTNTENTSLQKASSSIQFEQTEHDFGVIKQSGGIVSHDFTFTYQGDEAIRITATPGSCACTSAEVDKETLAPGEGATLTVFFNPNLHAEPEGRFSKTVSIITEPAIEPPPEVTVWQEIDVDLGEEFFELSGGSISDADTSQTEESHEDEEESKNHTHTPQDHGQTEEIAHSGEVPSLDSSSSKHFTLTAQEINSELDEGMEYLYWTYDGMVPGPFLRATEGDEITITLKNPSSNHMPHSIDLHAVNGPAGGAIDVHPGDEKSFRFTALNPGIYIYHCGTKEVAEHISNGAYGLILIEPKEALPAVDHEYYVVQGEFYPILDKGQQGSTQMSGKKLRDETPEYIVFNGREGALTEERALTAEVGDRIRLYVGNAGVAKVSSFHVIGEVFDTVYPEGGTPVQHNIQTTLIPAGGATIVEFTVDAPGTYKLVDHALARLNKGALAELKVSGPTQRSIFEHL